MWALRRAVNPLRGHRYQVGASRACYDKLHSPTNDLRHGIESCHTTQLESSGHFSWPKSFCESPSSRAIFSSGSRFLSSQAGMESSGNENDVEDGFSELETPSSDISQEKTTEESVDDLLSEPELTDVDELEENLTEVSQNELDLSDTEDGVSNKVPPKKPFKSELFRLIIASTRVSLNMDLNRWEKEGISMDRSDISLTMLNLRKRRIYGKALQLLEWLEAKKKITFTERDYASKLDLIAKVRRIHMAEKYLEDIPKSFRGEVIYRTLLANCVIANNVKRAEEVFNKMRDLEFKMTAFACNQLVLLYKRFDRKKIADVLLFMEKENIKPTLFTYRLLIDTKGLSNDITGMEKLLETMKEQGFEPDILTQGNIARHYIRGGFNEKAEEILKQMEGSDLKENRWSCRQILPLYAELGKADEVGRIWEVCDSNPRMEECLAAIEAWGKLGKIEEAEAVFERMTQTWKRLSSRNYNTLLKVYVNHKMLAKGKELVKRMSDSGCRIDIWTWDAVVKLYVEAGAVKKADEILQKAIQQSQTKPLFNSFMLVMDKYATRGDFHNAEKIFHRMKQSGYAGRLRQYESLLDAYVVSKTPAYGFRERMKADEVFPNKAVAGKLAQVDAFKNSAISDLLD